MNQQFAISAPLLQCPRQEVRDMRYSVLAGRILFSLLFIMAGFGHFSSQEIAFAAAQGVPLASVAVPLSGILAVIGGLSIALGYKARWGAALIVLFLVPVTITMHNFWSVSDPVVAQDQMAHFMKNISLIGSAFFIFYFGSGPLSLDAREHSYSGNRKEREAA
jgi:putative oxidoreductase